MSIFEVKIGKSKVILKKGDITKENVDVIVNAANTGLRGGGGVDGAIHRAGGPEIMKECRKIIEKIGKLPTGKVAATTAGKLKAKYVFHTPGPVYRGGSENEAELLKSSYLESLRLSLKKDVKSIAFPSISTGIYGYPIKEASRIALKTTLDFLREHEKPEEVRFILFSEGDFEIYRETLEELLSK